MQRAIIGLFVAIFCCAALMGCEESQPCDQSCDAGCDTTCEEPDAAPCDSGVGPIEGDEEALRRVMAARRSIRAWDLDPITREDIHAMLWAAQGITAPDMPTGVPGITGYRTSPSAGATYPLELYVVAENVEGMDQGVHWYRPMEETIEQVGPTGPLAVPFAEACNGQIWVEEAQANIVIAAVHERTMDRYGGRGTFYVTLEAGHAAQNIMLMAVARELGTVAIGAFDGNQVEELLELPEDHAAVYVITVGRPRYDP